MMLATQSFSLDSFLCGRQELMMTIQIVERYFLILKAKAKGFPVFNYLKDVDTATGDLQL